MLTNNDEFEKADDYLRRFQLRELIEEWTKGVSHERPQDPFDYLIRSAIAQRASGGGIVTCPNNWCQMSMPAAQYESHIVSCSNRDFWERCARCNERVEVSKMPQHKLNCRVMQCRYCGETILPRMQNLCPMALRYESEKDRKMAEYQRRTRTQCRNDSSCGVPVTNAAAATTTATTAPTGVVACGSTSSSTVSILVGPNSKKDREDEAAAGLLPVLLPPIGSAKATVVDGSETESTYPTLSGLNRSPPPQGASAGSSSGRFYIHGPALDHRKLHQLQQLQRIEREKEQQKQAQRRQSSGGDGIGTPSSTTSGCSPAAPCAPTMVSSPAAADEPAGETGGAAPAPGPATANSFGTAFPDRLVNSSGTPRYRESATPMGGAEAVVAAPSTPPTHQKKSNESSKRGSTVSDKDPTTSLPSPQQQTRPYKGAGINSRTRPAALRRVSSVKDGQPEQSKSPCIPKKLGGSSAAAMAGAGSSSGSSSPAGKAASGTNRHAEPTAIISTNPKLEEARRILRRMAPAVEGCLRDIQRRWRYYNCIFRYRDFIFEQIWDMIDTSRENFSATRDANSCQLLRELNLELSRSRSGGFDSPVLDNQRHGAVSSSSSLSFSGGKEEGDDESTPRGSFAMNLSGANHSLSSPGAGYGPVRVLSEPNASGAFMEQDHFDTLVRICSARQQLHHRLVRDIAKTASQIMKERRKIVEHITIPPGGDCYVVGDLHGQLKDLMHIFHIMGYPNQRRIALFNGDYVDRGASGCEVIILIFALLCTFPDYVYINRGNHEDYRTNTEHGFVTELLSKYGSYAGEVHNCLVEAYSYMTILTIVDQRVAVLHGGVPRYPCTISELEQLPYLQEVPVVQQTTREEKLLVDVLWNDPVEKYRSRQLGLKNQGDGWRKSKRGCGAEYLKNVTEQFLTQNKLSLVIRSHDMTRAGFEELHKNLSITIFSASDYCGVAGNRGAIAVLTKTSKRPVYHTWFLRESSAFAGDKDDPDGDPVDDGDEDTLAYYGDEFLDAFYRDLEFNRSPSMSILSQSDQRHGLSGPFPGSLSDTESASANSSPMFSPSLEREHSGVHQSGHHSKRRHHRHPNTNTPESVFTVHESIESGGGLPSSAASSAAHLAAVPGSDRASVIRQQRTIHDIREMIFLNRYTLLATFNQVDELRAGVVYKAEWCNVMRDVLGMDLPWYYLSQFVLPRLTVDGIASVQYVVFLQHFDAPFGDDFRLAWQTSTLKHIFAYCDLPEDVIIAFNDTEGVDGIGGQRSQHVSSSEELNNNASGTSGIGRCPSSSLMMRGRPPSNNSSRSGMPSSAGGCSSPAKDESPVTDSEPHSQSLPSRHGLGLSRTSGSKGISRRASSHNRSVNRLPQSTSVTSLRLAAGANDYRWRERLVDFRTFAAKIRQVSAAASTLEDNEIYSLFRFFDIDRCGHVYLGAMCDMVECILAQHHVDDRGSDRDEEVLQADDLSFDNMITAQGNSQAILWGHNILAGGHATSTTASNPPNNPVGGSTHRLSSMPQLVVEPPHGVNPNPSTPPIPSSADLKSGVGAIPGAIPGGILAAGASGSSTAGGSASEFPSDTSAGGGAGGVVGFGPKNHATHLSSSSCSNVTTSRHNSGRFFTSSLKMTSNSSRFTGTRSNRPAIDAAAAGTEPLVTFPSSAPVPPSKPTATTTTPSSTVVGSPPGSAANAFQRPPQLNLNLPWQSDKGATHPGASPEPLHPNFRSLDEDAAVALVTTTVCEAIRNGGGGGGGGGVSGVDVNDLFMECLSSPAESMSSSSIGSPQHLGKGKQNGWLYHFLIKLQEQLVGNGNTPAHLSKIFRTLNQGRDGKLTLQEFSVLLRLANLNVDRPVTDAQAQVLFDVVRDRGSAYLNEARRERLQNRKDTSALEKKWSKIQAARIADEERLGYKYILRAEFIAMFMIITVRARRSDTPDSVSSRLDEYAPEEPAVHPWHTTPGSATPDLPTLAVSARHSDVTVQQMLDAFGTDATLLQVLQQLNFTENRPTVLNLDINPLPPGAGQGLAAGSAGGGLQVPYTPPSVLAPSSSQSVAGSITGTSVPRIVGKTGSSSRFRTGAGASRLELELPAGQRSLASIGHVLGTGLGGASTTTGAFGAPGTLASPGLCSIGGGDGTSSFFTAAHAGADRRVSYALNQPTENFVTVPTPHGSGTGPQCIVRLANDGSLFSSSRSCSLFPGGPSSMVLGDGAGALGNSMRQLPPTPTKQQQTRSLGMGASLHNASARALMIERSKRSVTDIRQHASGGGGASQSQNPNETSISHTNSSTNNPSGLALGAAEAATHGSSSSGIFAPDRPSTSTEEPFIQTGAEHPALQRGAMPRTVTSSLEIPKPPNMMNLSGSQQHRDHLVNSGAAPGTLGGSPSPADDVVRLEGLDDAGALSLTTEQGTMALNAMSNRRIVKPSSSCQPLDSAAQYEEGMRLMTSFLGGSTIRRSCSPPNNSNYSSSHIPLESTLIGPSSDRPGSTTAGGFPALPALPAPPSNFAALTGGLPRPNSAGPFASGAKTPVTLPPPAPPARATLPLREISLPNVSSMRHPPTSPTSPDSPTALFPAHLAQPSSCKYVFRQGQSTPNSNGGGVTALNTNGSEVSELPPGCLDKADTNPGPGTAGSLIGGLCFTFSGSAAATEMEMHPPLPHTTNSTRRQEVRAMPTFSTGSVVSADVSGFAVPINTQFRRASGGQQQQQQQQRRRSTSGSGSGSGPGQMGPFEQYFNNSNSSRTPTIEFAGWVSENPVMVTSTHGSTPKQGNPAVPGMRRNSTLAPNEAMLHLIPPSTTSPMKVEGKPLTQSKSPNPNPNPDPNPDPPSAAVLRRPMGREESGSGSSSSSPLLPVQNTIDTIAPVRGSFQPPVHNTYASLGSVSDAGSGIPSHSPNPNFNCSQSTTSTNLASTTTNNTLHPPLQAHHLVLVRDGSSAPPLDEMSPMACENSRRDSTGGCGTGVAPSSLCYPALRDGALSMGSPLHRPPGEAPDYLGLGCTGPVPVSSTSNSSRDTVVGGGPPPPRPPGPQQSSSGPRHSGLAAHTCCNTNPLTCPPPPGAGIVHRGSNSLLPNGCLQPPGMNGGMAAEQSSPLSGVTDCWQAMGMAALSSNSAPISSPGGRTSSTSTSVNNSYLANTQVPFSHTTGSGSGRHGHPSDFLLSTPTHHPVEVGSSGVVVSHSARAAFSQALTNAPRPNTSSRSSSVMTGIGMSSSSAGVHPFTPNGTPLPATTTTTVTVPGSVLSAQISPSAARRHSSLSSQGRFDSESSCADSRVGAAAEAEMPISLAPSAPRLSVSGPSPPCSAATAPGSLAASTTAPSSTGAGESLSGGFAFRSINSSTTPHNTETPAGTSPKASPRSSRTAPISAVGLSDSVLQKLSRLHHPSAPNPYATPNGKRLPGTATDGSSTASPGSTGPGTIPTNPNTSGNSNPAAPNLHRGKLQPSSAYATVASSASPRSAPPPHSDGSDREAAPAVKPILLSNRSTAAVSVRAKMPAVASEHASHPHATTTDRLPPAGPSYTLGAARRLPHATAAGLITNTTKAFVSVRANSSNTNDNATTGGLVAAERLAGTGGGRYTAGARQRNATSTQEVPSSTPGIPALYVSGESNLDLTSATLPPPLRPPGVTSVRLNRLLAQNAAAPQRHCIGACSPIIIGVNRANTRLAAGAQMANGNWVPPPSVPSDDGAAPRAETSAATDGTSDAAATPSSAPRRL